MPETKPKRYEEIIETIRQACRSAWPGDSGERLAAETEAFVRGLTASYAKTLGLTEEDVLVAIESKRDYSAANYYQSANFPVLSGVRVFADQAELAAAMPSRRYRCPACHAISTHPYTCNSGAEMEPGKACDWKSWGLFRTMGKGLRFTVREGFLDRPTVDEIFLPIELEAKAPESPNA